MGLIRLWVEGFLRGRYGYEGPRAFWALVRLLLVAAVAIAVLRTTGLLLGGVTLVVGLLALRVRSRGLRLLTAPVLIVALLLVIATLAASELAGDQARQGGYDYVAEPRRYLPKPRTCSDYANRQEIRADDRAGKLSRDDKAWLDMDNDGRWCNERGVAWKGERTHAE